MMQQGVMRLLTTALTTLGFLLIILQLLHGVAIFVDPVAQAPRAPLLLLHQIPSSTYGKIVKHTTIFTA